VLEWNADPAGYIAKSLSPARVTGVYLNEHAKGAKTATVVVPEDQLSLAIGRDGQNARLAAKLTSWRIDIKSLPEAANDTLARVRTDPAMAAILESESDLIHNVEVALAKKAEGRPLTPEEFDNLNLFVDRVERRTASRRQAEKKTEERQRQEIRASLPAESFTATLFDTGIPEHIVHSLTEAGHETIGDLIVQLKINPDEILALQGIGPRAMQEIQRFADEYLASQVVAPAAPEPAEAVLVVDAPAAVEPEAVLSEAAPIGEAVEPVPASQAPEAAEAELAPTPVESVDEVVAVGETQPAAEGEEELAVSLDELFALKPEVLEVSASTEEEEEEGDSKRTKKGKKKKKSVEVEYDPDRDLMMVHKKHKRGGGTWDWE
jgi:N utilization substance protein A